MKLITGMSICVIMLVLISWIPCIAEKTSDSSNTTPCLNCSLKAGEKSQMNAVLLSTGPGWKPPANSDTGGAVFYCSGDSGNEGIGDEGWWDPADIGFDSGAWDFPFSNLWNDGMNSFPPMDSGDGSGSIPTDCVPSDSSAMFYQSSGSSPCPPGYVSVSPPTNLPPPNGCIGVYCDCTNYASICPGTYTYGKSGNRIDTPSSASRDYKYSCCGSFPWTPVYVQPSY